MDEVRIQIVNYKTKKYLVECFSSILADLKNSKLRYSIAVLDNASGEDLSDIRTLFPRLKKIEIYQGKKNLGFGAGQNFLSKRGQARFLLFLNPDIKIIERKTIERLMKQIKKSGAQVVGPRLTTKQAITQEWDHGELYGRRARIMLNFGGSYWQERKKIIRVAWVSGAVFLIEKRWFDNLGGFDKGFFLYKEEEDLCWRLRAKGGKILYNPLITIFHHSSVVAKKTVYMQKSINYFFRKICKN